MLQILKKIFIFLIPLLIITTTVEIYLRVMPSRYKSKRDGLVQNANDVQILILGHSHAANGINPLDFSLTAHNLAFGSQTIYFDRKLLEKYLPILPQLKYVIISFDYTTLYRENNYDRNFFYKYYYDIDYKEQKFFKEYILQSVFVYSPYTTLQIMISNLKNRGELNLIKGWDGSYPNSDYHLITSPLILQERIHNLNKDILDGENKEYILNDLEFMIDTLNSLDVKTILINFPIYKELREKFDKEVVKKNQEAAYYLIQKYDVIYLDYLDSDEFTIDDYYDSDHLNRYGAAKLTAKVDSVIKEFDFIKNNFSPDLK